MESLPDHTVASGVVTYTLPPLQYTYDALEPFIMKHVMTLHHSKHHQAYVDGLNIAIAAQTAAIADGNLPDSIKAQNLIQVHGGGHINHTLFWANLAPPMTVFAQPNRAPHLMFAIVQQYGSLPNFTTHLTLSFMGLYGSGWGWLIQHVDTGRLDLITTKNENLVPEGMKPIICIDLWEHAFDSQYAGDKEAYLRGIWSVINWVEAERRFMGPEAAIYGQFGNLDKRCKHSKRRSIVHSQHAFL